MSLSFREAKISFKMPSCLASTEFGAAAGIAEGFAVGALEASAGVGVAEGISCVGASCFWGESKSGVD